MAGLPGRPMRRSRTRPLAQPIRRPPGSGCPTATMTRWPSTPPERRWQSWAKGTRLRPTATSGRTGRPDRTNTTGTERGLEMLRRMLLLGLGVGLVAVVLPATSGASSAAAQHQARGSAAPAAPSFANEALWSSSDDWEPNVATDPSSSYVYEVTTRY